MRNDARFFFCISGFTGFLLFFFSGLVIGGDPVTALVQSAFGCLFFAICGRFLLCFILSGISLESNTNAQPDPAKEILPELNKIDAKQLTENAMSEASTNVQPLVQAKA